MTNGSGNGYITTQHRTAATDENVTRQATVVEPILDRVIPTWRTSIPDDIARNRWSRHREAALRARELLVREQELIDNLGDAGPQISVTQLHPWIWGGAASLWQSAHYREAVEAAIKKLNAETQNKLARRDVSETDLFKQAFSLDRPVPGRPRLRRMPDDGSKTYDSVHRGAMNFAEGIFAGIRNPLSHSDDQELTDQEALEYLAALSVLARWVDSSRIEVAQ